MPTRLDLPVSDEFLQAWLRRLEASRSLRKDRIEKWKEAIARVDGVPLLETPDRDVVVVNKEHPFVEMKKSQLLFQVPEVQLEPKMPGLEQAALLFQAVVNHELGPDAADVKTTIDETIPDTLVLGIGVTKIGYQPFLGEQEVQEPDVDPISGAAKMGPDMQPLMRTRKVPVLLKEEYFWDWVPVDKHLLPHEFKGLKFDRAPWQGFEFEIPLKDAKRRYGLPDDWDAFKTGDDDPLNPDAKADETKTERVDKKVAGVEIWYYGAVYDPEHESHPDKMRLLVLIEQGPNGAIAVRHSDSPYQRVNSEGKLTGLMGHPIHPLVLRKRMYGAYPKSDVELSAHISDELSKGRTQMVRQRETSIPLRLADRTKIEPDTLNKIQAGDWQAIIPVDPQGQGLQSIIQEIARAQFPRENFTFSEIADRDYEEMWSMSRVQRGLTDDTSKTATEVQNAQSASEVRLDAERSMVLMWFTKGARKFASLLQLFATDTRFVEVLGPSAMPAPPPQPQQPGQPPQQPQGLQAWNREAIQGEYVFKVKPDSGLRIDAAVRRKQMLDLYQMTANDPNVSRIELLKTLLRAYNVDPSRVVVEQLPPKGPEPPKPGLSFKGDDALNEAAMLLAKNNGVNVPDELLQLAKMAGMVRGMAAQAGGPEAPQPHGGAAQQQEPLSKHAKRGDGTVTSGVAQKPQGVGA